MNTRNTQHGAMLLVFIFLLFAIGTTIALSSLNSAQGRLERERKTQIVLAQARDALIAFAATYKTLPGRLPCPEDATLIGSPNEGNAQSSCLNSSTVIGRLPWRTLGIERLLDGDGEPLWYVRSQGFNLSPINSDTVGQIQLDGVSNSAVALIISSGSPLAGQSRPLPTAASPPVPAQYLDLGNVSGPAYVSIGTPNSFNDKVLPLTREQLFRAVETRVIGEVKAALEEYYSTNGYYPKPALFTDATCLGTGNNSSTCLNNAASCNTLVCRGRIPANADTGSTAVGWPPLSILRGTTGISPDWFQKNGWRELIYYAVAPACAETPCSGAGTLQLQNPPPSTIVGLRVIAISSGPTLAGQIRSSNLDKTTLSNYLEDKNLSPLDNIFIGAPIVANTPFNDIPHRLP
jgi:type II secretory pathway pseudopilin PulG